MIQNSVVFYKS